MKKDKLVVVGQGYVGLPIAMRAVDAGFTVVGLDVDKVRVEALQAGTSFVEDVRDDVLRSALSSGRYKSSTAIEDIVGFEMAIITVPTPLRESVPDLTFIREAISAIGPYVLPGATVVLESTTYPGTTQELVVPGLEAPSGLRAGEDFYVGYSPERIDPGNRTFTFVNTPKVVSGVNSASLDKIVALYSRLVDTVVPTTGTKEAELTKLLENTFRHVNIALVNELAMVTRDLGIDIWEVVDAAATKPFGFMKFTPGPGVGGHCLPVDPSYLSWEVRRSLGRGLRFVELANDVNEHMPEYVVQRVMLGLNDRGKSLRGSNVLTVGLAYKPDTGDIRESPAVRVAELLVELGAAVRAVDPLIEPHLVPNDVTLTVLDAEEVERADAIVVLTPHAGLDYSLLQQAEAFVLDTRNALGGTVDKL